MSLQSFELFSVEQDVAAALLAEAQSAHERPEWHLTTFSGFPAAMLFRPDTTHVGSLHYMFFPPQACQRFHYHPGGRYVVLLGDVDMHIHYSTVDCESNPLDAAETLVVPALTFAAVRFPAFFWHCFETKSESGSGVLALAFHDDDQVDDDAPPVDDDLMEEQTVYWLSTA